jgi:hypothetical protein
METYHLRLYIARGTPNSLRAERNLVLALTAIGEPASALQTEIVDVLDGAGLAVGEGVIVTPTLIGDRAGWRQVILGDLSDTKRLLLFLHDLSAV